MAAKAKHPVSSVIAGSANDVDQVPQILAAASM
jgi:hypothetical protein